MNEKHATSLERKIIAIALTLSAGHIALIAYAAYALGIDIPTCITDVKPFETASLTKQGDKRYEAHVIARMWSFEPAKIVLPVGSTVDFFLVSKDVTHGLHIAGTNANMMAEPNVVTNARVVFSREGVYPFVCHEFCGTGHQAMNGVIEVRADVAEANAEGAPLVTAAGVPPAGAPPAAAPAAPEAMVPGRKLLETKGCLACHSLTGAPMLGPTFKGLFGRKEELTDGSSVVVDDAYVRESILDPQKKIVKGFTTTLMPKLPMTDDEISQIIDYLKTLK